MLFSKGEREFDVVIQEVIFEKTTTTEQSPVAICVSMEGTLSEELAYRYVGLLPDTILIDSLHGVVHRAVPRLEVISRFTTHEFSEVIDELDDVIAPFRAEWCVLLTSEPDP